MLPLYQQIREYIYELITEQSLVANDKLPSERELVEVFQSTRITVREALVRLESEGIIYRANRRGWFIAPERFEISLSKQQDFHDLSQEQGRSPEVRVIYAKKVELPSEVKNALKTRRGSGFCICRSKSLDNRNIVAEQIFVDLKKFPKLDKFDLTDSLNTVYKKEYGVVVHHESSQIQVEALKEEMAEILETNNGAPCVKVSRIRYNKKKELVDMTIEYWIHNAISMSFETK